MLSYVMLVFVSISMVAQTPDYFVKQAIFFQSELNALKKKKIEEKNRLASLPDTDRSKAEYAKICTIEEESKSIKKNIGALAYEFLNSNHADIASFQKFLDITGLNPNKKVAYNTALLTHAIKNVVTNKTDSLVFVEELFKRGGKATLIDNALVKTAKGAEHVKKTVQDLIIDKNNNDYSHLQLLEKLEALLEENPE